MNRTEKQQFVDDLNTGLKNVQAMALLSFNKLSVEQMTSFRLSLAKNSINVKVVKNTLAKRVFNEGAYKELSPHLKGPTLMVYGDQDPVITAKSIIEWASKENFEL